MTSRAHFIATAAILVALVACWPDPKLEPRCREADVTFDMLPDAGACYWARRDVVNFRATFAGRQGLDVERTRGYLVTIADDSDGGAFYSEFWRIPVLGITDCDHRTVQLASFNQSLVHELVHGAEGCACVTLPDAGADCHIRWAERGIYAAIVTAENGPLSPAPQALSELSGAHGGER